MAIKVGGIEVVDNSRQLKNIASIDSGTVTAFNSALNTDPTKGTLTKTFAQNETANITLSSNVTVGPVVSVTKEVPQSGISTKGNWDVNSTASNYDFHNTAANVTLTPSSGFDSQVTSLTYASKTGHVTGNDTQAIAFKSDGTKVFTSGSGGSVYEHSLSTAWDLSTISYTRAFSHASQLSNARGLYFKPDGTEFYIVGNTLSVFKYTINSSYPWDLAYASYDSSNNISSQHGTGSQGIFFKPDGTKMFITDYTNNHIGEWSLSTAWDLSTVSHVRNANVLATPKDIVFNSDGTVIYIVTATKITEYNCSTAYDTSTMSTPNRDFTTSTQSTNNQGLTIRPDNSEIFIVNATDDAYEYNFGQTNVVTLGSGSFAGTDVGKRIVGNGGDVILTSTGGAFDTTGGSAFTDNSTIAAGSWQMFGLKSAGDVSGITISGKASSGNYTLLDTTDGHTHKVTLGSTSAGGDQGFTIDPNGLYLYTVSTQDDRVKRYDFGTPWDLSTLNTTATSGQSITTSGYDGNMIDVAFNPSGTKMYLAGQDSDYIYQWNLSTAWDLSTASYSGSKNVYASNRVNGGFNGIFVTPDGTKIYTVDRNTDTVVRWNFTATQDIVNISFDALTSVNSVNNYPFDIAFNPDGTAMYLSGNNSGFYKFNLSTPFELSSGFTHDTSFSVTVNTNAVEGFFIKPDETRIYTMYNNEISQWNIGSFTQPTAQYHVAVTNAGGQIDSSSFIDINSMTAAQSAGTGTVHYAVSNDGRTTWSVAKGTDGVSPIVRNNSGTWQYNNDAGTTAGYSMASGSYNSVVSADYGSVESSGQDIQVKPDGTKLYFVGTTNQTIYQYSLTTANDITTMSYDNKSFSMAGQDIGPSGIHFKPDGTKLYMAGYGNDQVHEYNLSTAWDVSTASYNSVNVSISAQESTVTHLTFKPDGTAFYIIGYSSETVYRYNLSTAWDLSTASYANQSFTVTPQATVPRAVLFNPTGTKMFISDDVNGNTAAPWGGVYEYNLSTAWDVSTATYSNNKLSYQNSNDYNFEGMTFIDNGTRLLVWSRSGNKIYEFSTTSSAYGTGTTWVNGSTNDELYTLQQALGAQAFNRMDKTQLDAIPDANHFPTGTSLDLMIALRMDTAAATLPTSDGVTLNYDAAALNEGAVLGTDYDFFHPAANKVQIKSLAAQNLKVRVV